MPLLESSALSVWHSMRRPPMAAEWECCPEFFGGESQPTHRQHSMRQHTLARVTCAAKRCCGQMPEQQNNGTAVPSRSSCRRRDQDRPPPCGSVRWQCCSVTRGSDHAATALLSWPLPCPRWVVPPRRPCSRTAPPGRKAHGPRSGGPRRTFSCVMADARSCVARLCGAASGVVQQSKRTSRHHRRRRGSRQAEQSLCHSTQMKAHAGACRSRERAVWRAIHVVVATPTLPLPSPAS